MRSAIEICLSLWRSAKAVTLGPRITVPSSFMSSESTPTGGSPARRQRSMQASVWPERISTPPSLATSGKTWPGRTKSAAPLLPLASAAHSIGAPLGRDTGGQAVAAVHRDGEGGAERGVIGGHHRVESQPTRLIARQRGADDPRRVA